MSLQAEYYRHTLNFIFQARTSRGAMKEKDSYFIKIWNEDNDRVCGYGEAGPLKGLSIDYRSDFEEQISLCCRKLKEFKPPEKEYDIYEIIEEIIPVELPSIRFCFETALLDLLNGGEKIIFKNGFYKGEEGIKINGLIWMGDMEFMLTQITEKIDKGFDCIKMKIGSLDFDKECDILEYIRKKYYNRKIIIRVDANGAFKPETALERLDRLSDFDIHSIEQPVAPGQLDLMRELCSQTPVAIALDEELIGINEKSKKKDLLGYIRPQFIILKPSLIGGLKASEEWIKLADELNIGWWITSALESNIGLNAICQFTAEFKNDLHQGLGTGKLYDNNIPSPLELENAYIRMSKYNKWDLSVLEKNSTG